MSFGLRIGLVPTSKDNPLESKLDGWQVVALLTLCLLCAVPFSQAETFAWDASPTSNVVYYLLVTKTTSQETLSFAASNNLTITVTNLDPLTNLMVVVAVDNLGNTSLPSNKIVYSPWPPAGLLRLLVEQAPGVTGPWTNAGKFQLILTNWPGVFLYRARLDASGFGVQPSRVGSPTGMTKTVVQRIEPPMPPGFP